MYKFETAMNDHSEPSKDDKPFEADTTIFYDKGKYAITINPDDKHQFYNAGDRLQSFRSFMNEQMLCYPQYGITYTLYVELSEPQSNSHCQHGPRLHTRS